MERERRRASEVYVGPTIVGRITVPSLFPRSGGVEEDEEEEGGM